MLISHGSQGVDERHYEYADALNAAGIAAFVMDHWAPRGIGKVHHDYAGNQAKGGRAPTMATDTIRAIDYLKSKYPNFTRFGHIGESMGGSAAIFLSKPHPFRWYNGVAKTNVAPLDAIVALYPGCFDRHHRDEFTSTPFLFVLGEKDDDTPAAQCVSYTDWMNGRGGKAKTIVLPGEYHDFDGVTVKTYFPQAQNPANCSRMIEKDGIVWEKTGEKFANNADGLKQLLNKCMGWGVTSGYTKDKFVAVPLWIAHFKNNL